MKLVYVIMFFSLCIYSICKFVCMYVCMYVGMYVQRIVLNNQYGINMYVVQK